MSAKLKQSEVSYENALKELNDKEKQIEDLMGENTSQKLYI